MSSKVQQSPPKPRAARTSSSNPADSDITICDEFSLPLFGDYTGPIGDDELPSEAPVVSIVEIPTLKPLGKIGQHIKVQTRRPEALIRGSAAINKAFLVNRQYASRRLHSVVFKKELDLLIQILTSVEPISLSPTSGDAYRLRKDSYCCRRKFSADQPSRDDDVGLKPRIKWFDFKVIPAVTLSTRDSPPALATEQGDGSGRETDASASNGFVVHPYTRFASSLAAKIPTELWSDFRPKYSSEDGEPDREHYYNSADHNNSSSQWGRLESDPGHSHWSRDRSRTPSSSDYRHSNGDPEDDYSSDDSNRGSLSSGHHDSGTENT
ncbi:hypothetical protein B0H17DRAFT_1141487 [Mycena rosella]|uniref:Uncharacterized protein n=1 Tax=Mycena rosella TaxID=1033263 RepID=A0AAD7D381_MYCRO|nr:hypothetical protein B0H17DRAFT_1141487 [Mycena rosella]